jgi:hypothetical protein
MGDIKVTNIIENEDGSAKVELDMSDETFAEVFQYGFIMLVRKGLEGEWQKCVSCGGPSKSDFCGFCVAEE